MLKTNSEVTVIDFGKYQGTLNEILNELKSINKKLDSVTPSLALDNEIISKNLVQSVESAIHDISVKAQ